PRILFSLARDGFLPRALGSVHPVYRTPQPAIIVQSLITLILAITGTFEKLTLIANVSVLALYLGCALAAWRLSPKATFVPWIACAVIVWLLTGMTPSEWLAFGASLAAATLFYLIVTRARPRLPKIS